MIELVSVRELALSLGCHPVTLYRLVERGQIPFIKIKGLGLRFRRDDLDAWLQGGAHRPAINPASLLAFPVYAIPSQHGGKSEMARKAKSKTRFNLDYGSVYIRKTKEGKTRYCIDYYNADGRRIQKVVRYAENWDEAAAALKDAAVKEYCFKNGIEPKPRNIRFKEFSKLYWETHVKVNRRGWQSETGRMENLRATFGEMDLREIRPMDVERFKLSRQKAGNKNSTINRYLALLKHMFSVAVREGYASKNPVKEIKLCLEKERKERVLSLEEETRLLKASPDYLKPMLITAIHSGLRRSEIMNLKWSSVDWKTREINVEVAKSGKSRSVPINSVLLTALLAQKAANGKSPYVFPNEDTKKPYTTLAKVFMRTCKDAEIKGLRFHDLRHSFASRILEDGASIEIVKSLLGHHSISVTERYCHSDEEAKRKAVELLAGKSAKEVKNRHILLRGGDMEEPSFWSGFNQLKAVTLSCTMN
jgi:excisionase family DNA binding protein